MSLYTVFISGASRGIGLGLVREFLKHSQFRVIATAREPLEAKELQSLQKNVSEERLIIVPLVVTSPESYENVKVQLASKSITSIDVLIANAGVLTTGQLALDSTVEAMRHDFETNVIGAMLTLQSFSGLVLASRLKLFSVMSSILGSIESAGVDGWAAVTPYRVSKAAINMYGVNFASEDRIKKAGGKVLLLHPGWVQTDMGGKGADITVDESSSGLVNVVLTALAVQTKSAEHTVPSSHKDYQASLSTNPFAFVDYRGELLHW